MKKVSLLSLLAVLTISSVAGAHTENPFYMPAKDKVYSITEFNYKDKDYSFSEKVGYGITNNVEVYGSLGYAMLDTSDENGFSDFNLGVKYRYLTGSMIGDVYAEYQTNIDDKIFGEYNQFNVGTVFGKRTNQYALAGKVEYNFVDPEVGDALNNFVFGAEGMYQFNNMWSANLGLEYLMLDQDNSDDPLYVTPQVNLTTNAGTFSVYYTTDIAADDENAFGLKYGVQF